MRPILIVSLVGIAASVGIATMSGAGVASAAPAGTLSATEYQELSVEQTAVRSLSHQKSAAALQGDVRICRRLTAASGLLRAERQDCQATFGWLSASVNSLATDATCAHRASVPARFRCLLAPTMRLSSAVHSLYQTELRLDRVATARHFTKDCFLALADTPAAIRDEGQMTSDASRMVAAIRAQDALGTQKWGSLYDAATAEAEAAAKNEPLSVCPRA